MTLIIGLRDSGTPASAAISDREWVEVAFAKRSGSFEIGNNPTPASTSWSASSSIPSWDGPRTPTITKYQASYGTPGSYVTVVYKKVGTSIVRKEGTKADVEIAVNVSDFELKLQDLGKVVKTQITFVPRFQRKLPVAARPETAVFTTTLLRNKRK